jgi:hyperosmotically inducible periplasmic protein
MRTQFATGVALLTAVLFAAPLSAGAADTLNKAENAVSDSWLTSKTKIALFSDGRVKGRNVSVETTGGKVFLRGKVDSQEAKSAAGDIAKNIEGVKSVKNDLQVVAPEYRKTVQANDTEITKAVEKRFDKDANLKKIDVRTDAGVVILSGEVPNISVSAKASEMAHQIDGVQAVKNELRVTQAKSN